MKASPLFIFLAAITFSLNAVADAKRADIEPFYAFLSNPASDSYAEAYAKSVTDSWISIGDYSGVTKSKNKFIGQIKGFSQLIPDLNWAIEEVIAEGDKIVVRSRATGTPQGPLFGVDGKGKSFDILAIDIHTVKNGKVTETYHVEDWAGALRQLSAKQ